MLPEQTERDDDLCRACGQAIDDTNERYAFGDDGILCWTCAVERGGLYDVEHECWVNEPDLRDLPSMHS